MRPERHPTRRPALAGSLCVAFLLAACGPGRPDATNAQSPATPFFILTEAQDGGEFPLRPGEAFDVRLRGNETVDPPTTWSLAETPSILRLVGRNVVSDDADADGAGATWTFRFTVVAEGRGRLTFQSGASGRRVTFDILGDETAVYD